MKVRFTEALGTADRSYAKGEEADLSAKEAKSLIEAKLAEPIGKKPAKRAETRKGK